MVTARDTEHVGGDGWARILHRLWGEHREMSQTAGARHAVVFDWAGTLVDEGSAAPIEALAAVFSQEGIVVSETDLRSPMGRLKRDHIRDVLAMPDIQAQWMAARDRPPSLSDVDRLNDSLEAIMPDIAVTRAKPLPKVLDALEELRRHGYKLGSTTGYTRRTLDALRIAAAALGVEVDAAAASDEVAQGRPHPWMIYKAMEQLGVYPPSRVIKVGDTPMDIQEARNAGCWAVGVVFGGNELGLSCDAIHALPPVERRVRVDQARRRLWDAGADAVLDDMGQLPAWLRTIGDRRHGR